MARRTHSLLVYWLRRLTYGTIGAALLTLSVPVRADNYSITIDAPAEAKSLLEQYLDIVRYRTREDIRDEYLDFLVDHAAEQAASLLATKGYFNSRVIIIDDRTGKTVGTDAQLSAALAAQQTRALGQRVHVEPDQGAVSGYTTESDAVHDAKVETVHAKPSYTIKVELGEQAKIKSAKLTMNGLINQQDPQRVNDLVFD